MAKKDWHYLYNTAKWKALRLNHLCSEPFCRLCAQLSRTTEANTVDHVIPHKGNIELFFDETNLQSLCGPCHTITKARQEHRGYLQGCDVNGQPLDAHHHWAGVGVTLQGKTQNTDRALFFS